MIVFSSASAGGNERESMRTAIRTMPPPPRRRHRKRIGGLENPHCSLPPPRVPSHLFSPTLAPRKYTSFSPKTSAY
jgi:hypothetical protein